MGPVNSARLAELCREVSLLPPAEEKGNASGHRTDDEVEDERKRE